MALKELSINQSTTQLVADINSNIEEVGGSASVSADGSATSLVGVLNEVFDGVSGAEVLSEGDSATDFVDALNDNFEAADGGGGLPRDFENLLILSSPTANTSEMVPDYKGEKFYLIYKDSASPVMPSVTTHYEFYDTNKANPTSVHGVGNYVVPKDGWMTVGNSVAKAYTLASNGIMVSRSRSRCYTNPQYRWILFGDSISILTYSHQYNKDVAAGYSWIMGEANHEISVNNRAVSGTSIMSANGVWSQVQATNFLPYDVCSIFIGSNDYTYGRDKATFKSEYKQVLDYIIAAKPSLKIFICTLIERGDVQVTQRFYDLSEGIRELGIEYSIPVLDLAQDCLLDLRDSEQQALWSRPDGNGGYDKLHPTQEAHELFLAPLFKAKLMKVLNDYTLFPDILELENFDEI